MSGSTTTGSNPNWLDGYVPPASEWNAWFGFKLDAASSLLTGLPALSLAGGTMTGPLILSGDPAVPLGAVTKQYADTKFPTTGGGNLSLQGSLTFASGWSFYNAQGNDIVQHSPGNFEEYEGATGQRDWFSGNSPLMILSPSTGLAVIGNIRANTASFTGDVTATGNLSAVGATFTGDVSAVNGSFTGNLSAVGATFTGTVSAATMISGSFVTHDGWSFSSDGSGNDTSQHSTGNYEQWTKASLLREWYSNNVRVMSLDAGGTLTTSNSVVSGTFVAGSFVTHGGWALASDGSGNDTSQHSAGNYDQWTGTTKTRAWVTNSLTMMSLDASGNLTCVGTVHASNVTAMVETLNQLITLVDNLQARIVSLEGAGPA